MKIYTDWFLKKGSTHKICQDYIITGNEPIPYVILADGCSSSPDTDIGARLICHYFKNLLNEEYININYGYKKFITNNILAICMKQIEYQKKILGFESNILDTTLLILYLYNDIVYVDIVGDGGYIVKLIDGSNEFRIINYISNAPYYPSYLIDKKRNDLYKKIFNKPKRILNEKTDYTDSMDNIYHNWYPIDAINSILIFSDGILSFIPEIESTEIMENILAFKSLKGQFIQRKMNRYIKNLEKEGITHYDDISIGGFSICR